MKDVRIYVDFFEIDLSADTIALPISYQLLDVKDLNKRKGGTTKTVKVPRSAKNDKIFGVAYSITAQNQFSKYTEHRVQIVENSLPIFDGFVKIQRVSKSSIEFFCYKDISKLKALFGERTLQDLNLQDLEHIYDETIFDTWAGTYPSGVASDYIYPVIDYGQLTDRDHVGTLEAPALAVVDCFPAVYINRLVRQCCIDSGYSLSTSFFDDPIIDRIAVPFTNAAFVHDKIGGVSINGFQGFNNAFQLANVVDGFTTLAANTEVFDPLAQWNGTEYTAGAGQTIKYTFAIKVEFPSIFTRLSAPSFFLVDIDSGSGYNEVRREPIERPNVQEFYEQSYNGIATLEAGDKIRFRFLFSGGVVSLNVKTQSLVFDPSAGGLEIDQGEIVQLAPNLPAMKQADFIRSLYKMFNWVIAVNDDTGVVTIETIADFYNDLRQIDMSEKLVVGAKAYEPSINYSGNDISRRYVFQYAQDGDDANLQLMDGKQPNALKFGDGELLFDDKGEATIVNGIEFAATFVGGAYKGGTPAKSLDVPAMINAATPNELYTEHVPRLLVIIPQASIEALSGGGFTELYVEGLGNVEQIPFGYFVKKQYNDADIDAYLFNLCFQTPQGETYTLENIIEKYWRDPVAQILTSAILTAYFNLTAQDVSALDFRAVWYVKEFETTFRLNKIIDYLPNGNQPTRVELMRIGLPLQDKNNFDKFTL
jgi:hypothetical protein